MIRVAEINIQVSPVQKPNEEKNLLCKQNLNEPLDDDHFVGDMIASLVVGMHSDHVTPR